MFQRTILIVGCALAMAFPAFAEKPAAKSEPKTAKEQKEDKYQGYMANPNQILGLDIAPMEKDTRTTRPQPKKGTGPTGSGVIYVREKIPSFAYAPFAGESYEAMVPDTPDLSERARLAVHGMTESTDPEYDYEITCWGWGSGKHSYHDYNGGQPKWIENLILMRTMTGSKFNLDIDKKMMETMLHMTGEDGLYWIPMEGAPWLGQPDSAWPWTQEGAKQVYDVWPMGRALMSMAMWHLHDPDNPVYREYAEKMIRGIRAICIDQDDWSYIRRHFYDGKPNKEERLWIVKDGKLALGEVAVPEGITVVTTHGTFLPGLARYYESTRYEPAKELADRLVKYLLGPAHILKPDGRWEELMHFHGMTITLIGLLDYAQVMNRPDIKSLVRKAYEYGRNAGNPALGWFPEYSPANHPNTEPCCIGDMTILAAKLSAAGLGDYWEDVETISQNLLAEAQVTDPWWMSIHGLNFDQPMRTAELVESADHSVGTVCGMVGVNGVSGVGPSHCCTGNGNRALYFAWRWAVTEKDGEVSINILQNRASKWVDVDSFMPYRGRVDARIKTDHKLRVRIPSWVTDPATIQCTVEGQPRDCEMQGRYLIVGAVKAGQRVSIEFPLRDVTEKIPITWTEKDGKHTNEFKVRLRGFNVVDIWPRHDKVPFFDRPQWRTDDVRWKKVTRFVPKDELIW